jgi:hypothetical protein
MKHLETVSGKGRVVGRTAVEFELQVYQKEISAGTGTIPGL